MKLCLNCKKEIPPERLKNHTKTVYCSRECSNAKYHVQPVFRICGVCGKQFRTKHRDAICCSNKCRTARYFKRHGKDMGREAWESLREFVLERDNYTCQDCGVFMMDIGLNAHHIKPLALGGANEDTNLITLCNKCHHKRHSALAKSKSSPTAP